MPRNPLRSEAEAFRFVLATFVYLALIAVAAAVATWLGLVVFLALSALVVALWLRREERPAHDPLGVAHRGGADERRILVIANETVGGAELLALVRGMAAGAREQVFVVTPALNSKLRQWASDEDGARAAAQRRLDDSLAELGRAGIRARGEVGDGDPLQAIEDALAIFGADEIVISTHPEGRSHWLERGVVDRARTRFAVPITHVIVDLPAD